MPDESEQFGDLMFFDRNGDSYIDHVAMYVGPIENTKCGGEQCECGGTHCDVVEAYSPPVGDHTGIIASLKEDRKTKNLTGEPSGFIRFGCIPSLFTNAIEVITNSPIGLVVTDPDGITITPDTYIETDEALNREVPGEFFYSIYGKDADGTPKTMVFSVIRRSMCKEIAGKGSPTYKNHVIGRYIYCAVFAGMNCIEEISSARGCRPTNCYLIQRDLWRRLKSLFQNLFQKKIGKGLPTYGRCNGCRAVYLYRRFYLELHKLR